MAKKRQRKKIYKIPVPKLEKTFNCPECGRKKVVEVRFNKKENKGYLRCRACGENYEAKLKRASCPIDVYYQWIDHIDEERDERDKEYENKIKEEGQGEDGDEEVNNENENEEDNEDENFNDKIKTKYDDEDEEY